MALDTTTWQRQLVNLIPSGTIDITENGEYDVSKYATADVNVSGLVPSGTIEITENGENIDVAQYAYADVNVISSPSNCVCGKFTTDATGGVAQTVTIPYTGSGYPISVTIFPAEGANNSNGTVYNTLHRYAVMDYFLVKEDDSTPMYNGMNNCSATCNIRYKSSSTTASTTTATNATVSYRYDNTVATGSSAAESLFINSATQLSIFLSSDSFGFLPNTEYVYIIGYSN